MVLTEEEVNEIKRVKAYFPFRVVSGVKLPSGEFEVFANATAAKANNYARKHNGQVWRID